MNPELIMLEQKRDELEAQLATARIKGDQRASNRMLAMLSDCKKSIATARALDAARDANTVRY